jgi:glucose-1-phosphate thymidylyltransferase
MKGIVLAGGLATRLYPATKALSKQVLPIYDKPMVYYPLSTLMLAGIRDVLVVSTPRDIGSYRDLLGDGSALGLSLRYEVQESPRGLADAFILGREFIGKSRVALVLGDNVFYGQGFSGTLENVAEREAGATIFAYYVKDPSSYGVVDFDETGRPLSIEEKPLKPKSNFAVAGLYFYDNEVIRIAEKIKPSDRGELEITSVNNEYLMRGSLRAERLGRGFAWLDTGTPDGLLEASNFIATVQKRQGLYVACIEEIAYHKGWIDKRKLLEAANSMGKTEYGLYLRSIACV